MPRPTARGGGGRSNSARRGRGSRSTRRRRRRETSETSYSSEEESSSGGAAAARGATAAEGWMREGSEDSDEVLLCPFCGEQFEGDADIPVAERVSKRILLSSHIWAMHNDDAPADAADAITSVKDEPVPATTRAMPAANPAAKRGGRRAVADADAPAKPAAKKAGGKRAKPAAKRGRAGDEDEALEAPAAAAPAVNTGGDGVGPAAPPQVAPPVQPAAAAPTTTNTAKRPGLRVPTLDEMSDGDDEHSAPGVPAVADADVGAADAPAGMPAPRTPPLLAAEGGGPATAATLDLGAGAAAATPAASLPQSQTVSQMYPEDDDDEAGAGGDAAMPAADAPPAFPLRLTIRTLDNARTAITLLSTHTVPALAALVYDALGGVSGRMVHKQAIIKVVEVDPSQTLAEFGVEDGETIHYVKDQMQRQFSAPELAELQNTAQAVRDAVAAHAGAGPARSGTGGGVAKRAMDDSDATTPAPPAKRVKQEPQEVPQEVPQETPAPPPVPAAAPPSAAAPTQIAAAQAPADAAGPPSSQSKEDGIRRKVVEKLAGALKAAVPGREDEAERCAGGLERVAWAQHGHTLNTPYRQHMKRMFKIDAAQAAQILLGQIVLQDAADMFAG